jgi:hypothetical protein
MAREKEKGEWGQVADGFNRYHQAPLRGDFQDSAGRGVRLVVKGNVMRDPNRVSRSLA